MLLPQLLFNSCDRGYRKICHGEGSQSAPTQTELKTLKSSYFQHFSCCCLGVNLGMKCNLCPYANDPTFECMRCRLCSETTASHLPQFPVCRGSFSLHFEDLPLKHVKYPCVLVGFSPGTPASSQSPKTYKLGALVTLN